MLTVDPLGSTVIAVAMNPTTPPIGGSVCGCSLYLTAMVILEVADGATKFIDDDGNYCVSFDDTAEIFPLVLDLFPAPVDYDDSECPF